MKLLNAMKVLIVNEYNNAYHRTIKKKTIDIKDNTNVDSRK